MTMSNEHEDTKAQEEYLRGKLADTGYPGYPATSQADEMVKKAGQPSMYPSTLPFYKEHVFEPTQTGVIGSPCGKCGGLPWDPGHVKGHHVMHPNDFNLAPAKVLEVSEEPVVWAERLGPNTVRYEFENIPHDDAMNIVSEILPKALELYLRKSKDYGGLSGGLGPKAPFVDMWRKILKLKRCMWDDEELKFEQTDEIIMDLIGTCLNILGEMSKG